ncbi:MAG: aldo/keto reductase [bacterium]
MTPDPPARPRPGHPARRLRTYLISDEDAAPAVEAAIPGWLPPHRHRRGLPQRGRRRPRHPRRRRARDALFVTTKLWPGNAAWGHTPKTTATTIEALETSLKRLGLDYVDLLPHPRAPSTPTSASRSGTAWWSSSGAA